MDQLACTLLIPSSRLDLNLALVLAIQVFVFRLPAATLLRYAGWVREPLTRVLLALNVVPTPERIAVAAKVALATLWYTAHFVEAVVKTRSLLHRFNTTSPVVRSLYVSMRSRSGKEK